MQTVFSPGVQDLLVAAEQALDARDQDGVTQRYADALRLVGGDAQAERSIRLRRGLALVRLKKLEAGATELGELLPDLEDREQAEALISIGSASMWMERTDEALAFAERAVQLTELLDDRVMRGPALALLSQTHGQRGLEGDLAVALELGDRALEVWVPGTRDADLVAHGSLHALTHYWVGGFEKAVELGRLGRDGGVEGLALAALGRHEEAIAVFDVTIARQRDDPTESPAYALNCSTAALRDLHDLDEGRRRNEEAAELFRQVGFESGVMQSEIDLLYTDLLAEDVARAEREWTGLWERAREGAGWERWLAPGRLSVARAEIALRQQRWGAAAEDALEAIEIAHRIGRTKYDVAARITLGTALVGSGRNKEAVIELSSAVAEADRLTHPPTQWQARAALGRALYEVGDDEGAASASMEAADTVRGFAATLDPQRAGPLLASPQVQQILRAS